MDNFHQAPIIQKVYDFYKEIYLSIEKMPKKDKYTLGEKLQNTTLSFLELLITASYLSKEKKVIYLTQANTKLDLSKVLIRLAQEIKAVPTNKYLSLQERLHEIGKMLGGWIRSLK